MDTFLEKLPTSIVNKIITFLPSRLTFFQKIEYMETVGMDAEYSDKKWETLPIETRQIHLKNKTLREMILDEVRVYIRIYYDAKFGACLRLFDSMDYYYFNRDLCYIAKNRDITIYREDLDSADYVEYDSTEINVCRIYFGGKRFLVYSTREYS